MDQIQTNCLNKSKNQRRENKRPEENKPLMTRTSPS